MFPLMLSITVDLFLLTRLILNNSALSTVVAVGAILMFFGLLGFGSTNHRLSIPRIAGGVSLATRTVV